MEIAAALAAAYAISMACRPPWAALRFFGLRWGDLGGFSHAHMLHNWRLALPAIIKGQ